MNRICLPEQLKKITAIILLAVSGLSGLNAIEKTSQERTSEPQRTESPKITFVKNLQALLSSGDYKAAVSSFDSLPEELKADTGLQLIKCSLLVSSNQSRQALELVTELEKRTPDNIGVLEMKIVVLKSMGNNAQYVQAKRAAISKVIQLDPNNPTANVELGQEQVLLRKYKVARSYYQKALKQDPSDSGALFGYGQTSYYINDIEEARKAFQKMVELNPYDSLAWAYLGKLSAEEQSYKPALEYVTKAISIEPAYDYYMDLGNYNRFLGRFAAAEDAWTKAINMNPDYFLAYAYRGGLYDEQNKFDKALGDYRMVVKTNPDYYYAYESLGNLAWYTGNWEEARLAYEKAYSYYKDGMSYPLMIAACWIKQGKQQQAKLFLEKVMKTFEDKKSLEFSMIRLYHDWGPSNAENDIALKITKIDKMNQKGKMLFYFGLFYEMKDKNQLAKKYYTEVKNMQSPMFFEYRLAEWGIEK